MVVSDTGHSLDELFSEFERDPIGVASLAQVHRARLRKTEELVAVKVDPRIIMKFMTIPMRS